MVFSQGRKGIEQVAHGGLACAMVATKPLKSMQPPLFLNDWLPSAQDYCGEDTYFCHQFQEQTGYGVWVDHDLSQQVRHIGEIEYGHDHVDEQGLEEKGQTRAF